MLYEAARWNPDWPREPMEEVLAEPMLTRFHQGWGRPGDAGVIAELDGVPVGAAWYRLFCVEEPGYGFVDKKIPNSDWRSSRSTAARASAARCSGRSWCRRVRRASSRSRSRSPSTTGRA